MKRAGLTLLFCSLIASPALHAQSDQQVAPTQQQPAAQDQPATEQQPPDQQRLTDQLPKSTPPSMASHVPSTAAEVQALASTVEVVRREQQELQWWLTRGSTITVVALAFLGFLGYSTVKLWVVSVVEARLQKTVDTSLGELLPRMLHQAQAKAEAQILRLATLLALNSQKAYDTLLVEFGWTGSVAALRTATVPLRRVVIEALHGATANRRNNRAAAWDALVELLKDDRNIETLRLFLRLCVSHRRYAEGAALFEESKETIVKDKECALRIATIFRKQGRLPEARDLVIPFLADDDIEALVAYAVLERDLGRFDEVHDRLLPAVHRLTKSHSTQLAKEWQRLINTYVANCLDRDRPDDAIEPAEFVLRSAPGPVELFTVGRLILALNAHDARRADLLTRFRSGVEALVRNQESLEDASHRCLVTLREIDGNLDAAIQLTEEKIAELEAKAKPGAPMHQDTYYQRCSLADLLTQKSQPSKAVDVLMPAVGNRYGGEAKFRMAVAYAALGEGNDSARWLRQAFEELPKWAVLARDRSELRGNEEVARLIAELRPGQS